MPRFSFSFPRLFSQGIAFKVAWRVILFSTLVAIFSTCIQLYIDYRKDIKAIDEIFLLIKKVHLKSIAQWALHLDDVQLKLQLDGIVHQRDIVYAAVIMNEVTVWQAGVSALKNIKEVHYPLSTARNEQQEQVGTLVVIASLDGVYERLLHRAAIILVSNGIKTFLVAAFILLLFHHLVTRHLSTLAAFVRHLDVRASQKPMQLERRNSSRPDELDEVVTVLNTMRKRGHEAYRDMEESEQRLRFFFNSTEEGIFTVDQDGVCVFMNGACLNILGFSQENGMLGKNIQSFAQTFLSDNPEEQFTDHISKVLKYGRTHLVQEQHICRPDGSCLYIFLRIYPLMEGEKINGAIVFLTDITLQHRLRREKHLLTEAIRQSPVAIVLSDERGLVQYVNPGFCRITGYSPAEVVGRRPYYFRNDIETPNQGKNMRRVLRGGKQWFGRLTNRKKSGAVFILDTVVAPIRNEEGIITNFVAVGQDITKEMNLQYQLQHIQKLETLGKLSASIAHEFGNPLLGVRFAVRAIKSSDSLDEDERRMMELAEEECNRMRTLIRELQHLKRPTSGRSSVCDINALLDNVLLFQKKFLKERNIVLQKKYDRNLPEIFAVSDQIRQVVINLIINAAEAMVEKGGVVIIKTAASDDSVILTITDTGPGIAEADLPHVFEPFFTTKGEVEGIGLGLAVSYGIIANHGGAMNVKSKTGQGASFIVSLPI